MTASAPIAFDVFFDYQCPFVYRAAGLIDAVRRSGRRDIDVRWRYFSLTQVNSKDDGWTVWGAPASDNVRGRRRDLADPRIYDALARDHSEAVSELGVFGTPTLVFADGASAYVRLSEPVEGEGAVEVFDRLLSVAASEPRILEIKRPRRPVPV